MSSPFERFDTALANIAHSWPNHEPAIIPDVSQRPSATPYHVMAEVVMDRLQQTSPALPEKLLDHNATHGAKVIARYCNIAALLAEKESMSSEQLETVLRHPRSFEPLASIASVQNSLAVRNEREFGLNADWSSDGLKWYTSEYQINDGVLQIPNLLYQTIRHKLILSDQGEELYEGKCAAHRSAALEKIYHHFVTICAKDEALFPTLD